jgi:hypothetical protein
VTILVEARHFIRPITAAAFNAYVDFYGSDVIPAMQRNGFELVGAWKRSGGIMGQDVALYRFDSMADYEKANASLGADASLGPVIAKMLESVEMAETTKIGTPLGEAAERGLARALAETPPAPRQYGQAVTKLVFSGQMRALELLEEMAAFGAERRLGSAVASYRTTTGPGPEATQIWLLPDGAAPLAYQREDPFSRFIEPLREVAPEEEVYWLSPLPYSPLQ